MKKILQPVLFLVFGFFIFKSQAQSFVELGTNSHALNANFTILSVATDSIGNVYAAGAFTDSAVSYLYGHCYVAKWDGINWAELGGKGATSLSANSNILSIAVDNSGNVYAAGAFTDSTTYHVGSCYVAKWDGTSWTELGGKGINGLHANAGINTIAADNNGNIYAGGRFTDSVKVGLTWYGHCYVAKWDGTSWTELGGKGATGLHANSSIASIALNANGNVYATGFFTDSTTSALGRRYVAKWDGTNWSKLGANTYSNIFFRNTYYNQALGAIGSDYVMLDPKGNIYASGAFVDSINGVPYNAVAKYDGSSWSKISLNGSNMASGTIATGITDKFGRLYVSGNFLKNNTSIQWSGILEWTGTQWQQLFQTNNLAYTMSKDKAGLKLYAAGGFTDSLVYPNGNKYVAEYAVNTEGEGMGVEPIANSGGQLVVYPNPTSNQLTVVSHQFSVKIIEVRNVLGQIVNCKLVFDNSTDNCKLTTENLPSGIYFIKAADANGNVRNAKFVKE